MTLDHLALSKYADHTRTTVAVGIISTASSPSRPTRTRPDSKDYLQPGSVSNSYKAVLILKPCRLTVGLLPGDALDVDNELAAVAGLHLTLAVLVGPSDHHHLVALPHGERSDLEGNAKSRQPDIQATGKAETTAMNNNSYSKRSERRAKRGRVQTKYEITTNERL